MEDFDMQLLGITFSGMDIERWAMVDHRALVHFTAIVLCMELFIVVIDQYDFIYENMP